MGTATVSAFIVSHVMVECDLPIEIAPKHMFRRATIHETKQAPKRITETLQGGVSVWPNYHGTIREEITDNMTAYCIDELPLDKQNYYVIEALGGGTWSNSDRFEEIDKVGRLLNPELEIGFPIWGDDNEKPEEVIAAVLMPYHIIQRYNNYKLSQSNAVLIERSELENVGQLLTQIGALPEECAFLTRAINNFYELRLIPHSASLQVAGLFSIIEMLLTHKPGTPETFDTITHQLKTKSVLVNKFFEKPLKSEDYFLAAKETSLWQKLYGYRSAIVHGGVESFEGNFEVLRSRESVVDFLETFIRQLLRLSLSKPQFILDLKRC